MDKWNEAEYLANPVPMTYETIVQLGAPEPDEIYRGGEDVFCRNEQEMDFVDESVTTGLYFWDDGHYFIELEFEWWDGTKRTVWFSDKDVWLCKYEQDDDDDKPLGVLFIAGEL